MYLFSSKKNSASTATRKLVVVWVLSDLACGQEVLGRAYGVLSKRRAQIISEDVKEGTQMFLIEAFLPVAEAFGVADDLRSKASGYISLQLQLSHWSMITDDPFPEATLTSEVTTAV